MKVSLSDHFTYKKLFRFVLPSILTMIVTSIYSVVDGFFVSNCVGKNAFAAVNIVIPFLIILSAIGFMIGEGGCALVSKTLGEGDKDSANRYFSMMVYLITLIGIGVTVVGFVFMPQIVRLLGATPLIVRECIVYGRIAILSTPCFMLMVAFGSFLVTAEKAQLGLYFTICSGVTNIILDFVLVYLLDLGVGGAAAATACGEILGGVLPFIYFARENNSLLRIVKTRFEVKPIVKACTNGASEMIGAMASSFVAILYNLQLMRLAGEDGVSAFGVLMYISSIFSAIFAGYAMGVTPIFGFNFGAKNDSELHNVVHKSYVVMIVSSVLMTICANLLSGTIARIYVGYDEQLCQMTEKAMLLFSLAFLFCGLNVLASSLFTGLNNGKVSMLISFVRTVVLQFATVMVLPVFLDLNGVWLAQPASEMLAAVLAVYLLVRYKKVYNY